MILNHKRDNVDPVGKYDTTIGALLVLDLFFDFASLFSPSLLIDFPVVQTSCPSHVTLLESEKHPKNLVNKAMISLPPTLSLFVCISLNPLSLSLMAILSNFLSNPPSSLPIILKTNPLYPCTTSSSSSSFYIKPLITTKPERKTRIKPFAIKASTSASSAAIKKLRKVESDEKVQQVHTVQEFDEALRTAKNKLVVVEYAASHSYHSRKIYPFMVDLSKTCNDVVFLLVMGDESDDTKLLCEREKIAKVPHFSFYKGMEKIHEEEGIGPDELVGDVLYYGDNHSAVVQLHSGEDVEALIESHKVDHKLIVLDVGLKHCGPCVKVYPTVIKLSKQMKDTVVFARMNGDENESCMKFLKEMEVVEVPTFLFIRDGEICGRYVGSGKGELIGEILRYQGVRVT